MLFQIAVPSGSQTLLSYDANGNLTYDGSRTFEWDAENRLAAINYMESSKRTEFTYDGLNRRVRIVEKEEMTTVSTKNFLWCANMPCEERDASNAVTKRFYNYGVQIGGTAYFYSRDHLGSIREVVDNTGAVRTEYDYTPWGVRKYATYNPPPVSGTKTQHSEIVAGAHQHYFSNATTALSVDATDKLICYVWLDPAHPPRNITLQWNDGSVGETKRKAKRVSPIKYILTGRLVADEVVEWEESRGWSLRERTTM